MLTVSTSTIRPLSRTFASRCCDNRCSTTYPPEDASKWAPRKVYAKWIMKDNQNPYYIYAAKMVFHPVETTVPPCHPITGDPMKPFHPCDPKLPRCWQAKGKVCTWKWIGPQDKPKWICKT